MSNGIGIEFKFSGGRLETVCQNLPCLGRPLGNGNLDRHVTFLKVGNRQAAAVNDPVHAGFISLLQQVIIQIHLPHQITHDVHVGTGLIQRFNHRFGEGQIAALVGFQFASFHRGASWQHNICVFTGNGHKQIRIYKEVQIVRHSGQQFVRFRQHFGIHTETHNCLNRIRLLFFQLAQQIHCLELIIQGIPNGETFCTNPFRTVLGVTVGSELMLTGGKTGGLVQVSRRIRNIAAHPVKITRQRR